jgi:hypothetical protein
MHVRTENDALIELYNDDVVPPEDERTGSKSDYRLTFSENNLAQCKREVGTAYLKHYDTIHRHDAGD